MAFERMGLGGVVTLDTDPAVRTLGAGSNALGRFTRQTNAVGPAAGRMATSFKRATQRIKTSLRGAQAGLDKFSGAMRNAALVTVPAGIMMYKAAKSAANFEQAIADLGAVSGASEKDLARLSAKAKEMGIVTAFSASESANAMEQLARAGATVTEQISGVRGVLDLAAAGNVQYAESSEIVASITRAMGREFKTSSNLADILARAAARSNVTVTSLGESFRYGAPQAKSMGISTEWLTTIFGKLGDAGIKGSMGGTALTSMLVKLGRPSKEAAKLMEMWKIKLTDATGALKPMPDIIEQFQRNIEAETDAVKRAAMMTELFGIRGQKAYSALATAGGESLRKLHNELKRASDGLGAATTMAEARLDTLVGSFKMLGASVEGLSIAMFQETNVGIKGVVQSMTAGLNSVLYVMGDLRKAQKAGANVERTAEMLAKKHGDTAVSVAQGILEAVESIREAWETVVGAVRSVGQTITSVLGKSGVKALTSLLVKVTALAAVLGPVMLALSGISFVISRVLIPAVFLLGKTLMRAFTPWLPIIMLASALISKFMDKAGEKSSELERSISMHQAAIQRRVELTAWQAKQSMGESMDVISAKSTEMGSVVSGSFDEQKASAVQMGADATASYEKVANQAVISAGLATDAWTEGATKAGSAWAQLSQQEIQAAEEHTGAIGFLGLAIEGVAESAVWLYEVLGGATAKVVQQRKETALLAAEYKRLGDKISTYATGRATFMETMLELGRETAELVEIEKKKKTGEAKEEIAAMKAGIMRKREAKREATTKAFLADLDRTLAGRSKGKQEINIKNTMCVDGKEVATAVTRHTAEVHERAGFKKVPWQRRAALEFGAIDLAPAKASGTV